MVPFNAPGVIGRELQYLQEAAQSRHLAGDGPFTKRCEERLKGTIGASRVLMTTSCTHALEMAALLLKVGPGDEVILPSFTFVSTANAFALRGATPRTLHEAAQLIEPQRFNVVVARPMELVNTTRKGVTVRTRSGYVPPS